MNPWQNSFSVALEAAKQGKAIQRAGWNGNGLKVKLPLLCIVMVPLAFSMGFVVGAAFASKEPNPTQCPASDGGHRFIELDADDIALVMQCAYCGEVDASLKEGKSLNIATSSICSDSITVSKGWDR